MCMPSKALLRDLFFTEEGSTALERGFDASLLMSRSQDGKMTTIVSNMILLLSHYSYIGPDFRYEFAEFLKFLQE
ncbi:hypothetical protein Pyn_38216 [Prunus yedoensis var. nudiflora]|uniref:Uncharacterized protein n=1 Tax=Prunus yedoensis var. nudiflora TaxID=2094558 RepID=A0A314XR92_PRUYE|nr:hypothetical protein Pyn_38216 [Prunus yedoensis var. nudiflora]